jgi:uncharacterized protein YfdQ (DUF2303 family)
METTHDFSEIITIAQKAMKPEPIAVGGTERLLFLPANEHEGAKIVDLDQYAPPLVPRRKSGTIVVFSVHAFNNILFANKDAGTQRVYLDQNLAGPVITGVMNDHGEEGPGWRDFRCVIQFRETVQWKKWRAIDGKMLSQEDFAEFIEQNITDIFDPPGAQMLEIVTYLQATRSVDFKSALSLSNGQVQLQNIESVDAKVGAGQLAIPAEFTLALMPIQGADTFKIPARFRYRIVDGKLRLGLKLLRIEEVMDQIFDEAVKNIAVGEGVTMIAGTP